MNIDTIKHTLTKYDQEEVDTYIAYLNHLANEKKGSSYRNPWLQHRNDEYLAGCFKQVSKDGLAFDGKNITLQSTGISYSYVAYKNKMLNIYPETLFDAQLVREGDNFKFSKESGKVTYQHEITNPFGDSEIIGAYCVIRNKRGEFLTTLSRSQIDKHRQIAKTDYIWANWTDEMILKTIIKKACKSHFADIYHNIETLDNTQTDLDLPLDVSIETKQAIEAIETLEELTQYYQKHKNENSGVLEGFTKLCANRKQDILQMQQDAETEGQETENADS